MARVRNPPSLHRPPTRRLCRTIGKSCSWTLLGLSVCSAPEGDRGRKSALGRRWRQDSGSGPLALPRLRVPIALEIGDQSVTEMAVRLLLCVEGQVAPEEVERLLSDA